MAPKKSKAAEGAGTRKSKRIEDKTDTKKRERGNDEIDEEPSEQPKGKKAKKKGTAPKPDSDDEEEDPPQKPKGKTVQGKRPTKVPDRGDDDPPKPQKSKKGGGKKPMQPAAGDGRAGAGPTQPAPAPEPQPESEPEAPESAPAPAPAPANLEEGEEEEEQPLTPSQAEAAAEQEAFMIKLKTYSQKDPYSGWKHHELGEGGQGVAYILLLTDKNGNVRQRQVMKDTFIKSEDWNDWTRWSGNPRFRAEDDCEPIEVHAQRAMSRAYCPNSVGYRSHIRKDKDFFLRILMDWCPHGDLSGIMPEPFVTVEDRPDELDETAEQAPCIPESALWKFFLDMTNACCYMAFGQLDGKKGPKEGWRPIVHRDLKPDNIFLSEPKDDSFPSYPTARVGDFGLAAYTDLTDPENPQGYGIRSQIGTPGYQPIEFFVTFKADNFLKYWGKLDPDKTNVWGIGAVMLRLMTRERDPPVLDVDLLANNRSVPELRLTTIARSNYSEALANLVENCVRTSRSSRIGVVKLRKAIIEHIENNPEYARLQTTAHTVGEAGGRYDLAYNPVDPYKIHVSR